MRLPRGIFVKLVSIFLLIGLVPFLGLSLWTYEKARVGMTLDVTEYWLVRQARETAAALDREVDGMRTLIRSWADDPKLANEMSSLPNLTDPWGENSGGDAPEESELLTNLRLFLERRRNYRKDLDLILLVRTDGLIVAESSLDAKRLRGRSLAEVLADPGQRKWVEDALAPSEEALAQPEVPVSTQDWHLSPLVSEARGEPPYDLQARGYPKDAGFYAIGFAGTIVAPDGKRTLGALVGLFSWRTIQGVLDDVVARFESPDDPLEEGSRYSSGYPFLFSSNRDTIIAHKNQSLIGDSLEKDHGLGHFREEMRKAHYGSYRYEYPPGTEKLSGYAYTARNIQGGFGWVVGVGINDTQIYAQVMMLRDFMIIAVLIVTGMVILLAAVFSHRITEPITRLIAYTEEVARGNLDARVDIHANDEIAVLADSFNKMAEDLGESNRRLIKAEKDAAWQEMARQVAHEIKNPLTPIMLSAQQLKKAHEDRHQSFDEILDD